MIKRHYKVTFSKKTDPDYRVVAICRYRSFFADPFLVVEGANNDSPEGLVVVGFERFYG